jgi:uncharacterized protein YndB with AHSA1/START domain
MTADLGQLEPVESGWRIVYVRRLAHPVEKVWRAVTEPEHLAEWFPHPITGEFVVGAALTFHTEYAEIGDFHGTVRTVTPPRLLEFTWGEDALRIELEPTDDGCVLTFTDTFVEVGKAARDGAGWHVCLDRLVDDIDGTTQPASPQRWNAVHPTYVATFGPRASTEGPPEFMTG